MMTPSMESSDIKLKVEKKSGKKKRSPKWETFSFCVRLQDLIDIDVDRCS